MILQEHYQLLGPKFAARRDFFFLAGFLSDEAPDSVDTDLGSGLGSGPADGSALGWDAGAPASITPDGTEGSSDDMGGVIPLVASASLGPREASTSEDTLWFTPDPSLPPTSGFPLKSEAVDERSSSL